MVLPPSTSHASSEALFRYQVVSHVLASVQGGSKQAEAVREAAGRPWLTLEGRLRTVGKRTVYRWLGAYQSGGLAALEPSRRGRRKASQALPPRLVEFVSTQKESDPAVSIPEILRRARQLGIVGAEERIDRSTVYRAARRLELPVRRQKTPAERDARRFAYPHRLDCVLCDGKHFRAGAERRRRVALFFLDDATRYGLHVVVGTSESASLFLRGLYEVVKKYGLMSIVYLDRGPGFIAADSFEVVAHLGALFIRGERAYPEGHGKIERFNQSARDQVLRGLDRRPDVDPDCGALELRLGHYLLESYAHTPHEALELKTPFECFQDDPKPLSFPEGEEDLRRRFIVHFERTVSKDHIVSIDGIDYEVPRGLAERRVTVHHQLLDGTHAVLSGGALKELSPVDLTANARSPRARRQREEREVARPLPKSAADLAFDRDFAPVVEKDGGLSDHES